MSPRPGIDLRRQVFDRAGNCCEYCLVHQSDTYISFHLDHIIAEKHGGLTALDNLALSCMPCNRRKGSDISSIDPSTGQITPLFNPRTQVWAVHFTLNTIVLIGLTPQGRATVHLLQLNSDERLLEREELIRSGHYVLPDR